MPAVVVGACLWALLLWFQIVHYLPQQRAIVGCKHTKGHIVACVPDVSGRPSALVWFCNSCGFQAPLKLLRGPRMTDDRQTWLVDEPLKEKK